MSMMIRRGVARVAKAAPVVSYAASNPDVKEAVAPVEEVAEEKPVLTDLVTKAEVEKMKYFGLKSLAAKHGIDATGKNTADLKAAIIETLNL